MEEVRRKMRSCSIQGFYSVSNPVEDTNQITGTIYVVTEDRNEIVVFMANVPISRTEFNNRFAALETSLNETWFEMPASVEYRP